MYYSVKIFQGSNLGIRAKISHREIKNIHGIKIAISKKIIEKICVFFLILKISRVFL